MKKFNIREVETVKTTAALYHCSACPWKPWCQGSGDNPMIVAS